MSNAKLNLVDLFDQVYTDVPIGITLISAEGQCLKVNPAFCRIVDYTAEQLLGMTFRDITHPDDLDKENRIYRNMIDGTIAFSQREKRFVLKHGRIAWVSQHSSAVRDEDGSLLYIISHFFDITEEKLSKEKLFEIEEAYHLIAQHARDLIAVSTPDGIVRFISPSVRELLGYEPEETVGRTNIELYHHDDIAYYKGREIPDDVTLTYRLRHKDGRWIWFETKFRQIRNEQGQLVRTVAIGRDITERKKHESNLAEIQRIAQIGSWEWDIAANETVLSDELYGMLGVDKSSKLNHPTDMMNRILPEDQEQLQEQISGLLEGEPLNLEYRAQAPDGSLNYFHIRGTAARDDNGDIVKVSGTVQDITERKTVEKQLQETVQRYNSLKRYNHDAVLSFDLDGRFVNANIMASRLTGYAIEEMRGRHYGDFFEPENIGRTLRTIDGGEDNPENEMNRIFHRDGHSTEVLTAVAPIVINDQMQGFYIIAKDFTEQKKLILEKEAAENTNKAKSNFFAMMSHEIRTPMNGVIGMTDLLMETGLDSEQEEYVQVIRRSGESLIKIINDILDFSKIEFGHTNLDEDDFDVRRCMMETMELLYPLARSKQLKLDWTIGPEVPGNVVGDSDRLKQVLNNLIGNAIKFTDRGEVGVTVTLKDEDRHRCCLSFAVRDTGVGIPADKVKYLFEPFSQLDTFMNRNVGGTGLGLAISKKLVEMMGGEIGFVQPDGPGTEFHFSAWFGKQKTDEDPVTGRLWEKHAGERPLRILIAEDNEVNQLVLKRLLEKQGHTVEIALNGRQAVSATAGGSYDIVFMDMHMPEMNGLEATRAIKETLPRETCPVIIAVTANASAQDRDLCLAAGMDDYISKPLKGEIVRETVKRHLGTVLKR